MESSPGSYAGGECRNRLVEGGLHLDKGLYRVCYVSDDAHSYAGWSKEPPFEAAAWGMLVRGAGADFDPAWVEAVDPGDLELTRIALAPMRSDESRRLRFEIDETLTFRLIALGEGKNGEMYDHGWIENESTGERIWEMEYRDTHGAGGGSKNRRVERVLRLEPGRYALHYESDDSHAFGDWNDDPPDDPQLWGITLLEVPGN
jgi:hypothetical protein